MPELTLELYQEVRKKFKTKCRTSGQAYTTTDFKLSRYERGRVYLNNSKGTVAVFNTRSRRWGA